MREFIARYWLEVLFGVIVTIGGVVGRYLVKIFKEHLKAREVERRKNITSDLQGLFDKNINGIISSLDEINKKINKLDSIQAGVLEIQGLQFKNHCREILEQEEPISIDQWENIAAEHKTYNSLGGNHEGDALFFGVQNKYQNQDK